MYFKITSRYNILNKTYEPYCRLVESYRNSEGLVCHKTIIQVGFITDATLEQMNIIQKQLTLRAEGRISFFEETDVVARQYIDTLWGRMITEKRIDLPEAATAKKEKMLYENSMTLQTLILRLEK